MERVSVGRDYSERWVRSTEYGNLQRELKKELEEKSLMR
jgi:hypothetical protein